MSGALLLRCDAVRCTAYADVDHGESLDEARARLKAHGWAHVTAAESFVGALDLCPAHAKPLRNR